MHQILLVEDSPEYIRLVPHTLGASYSVTVAPTLEDARKILREKDFDLILLDVVLPDGLGFDFYPEIRAAKAALCPPIIFISGRGEVEDRVMGWSLGAEDYITKPFSIAEFQIRIKNRIESHDAKKSTSSILKWSNLVLDMSSHSVTIAEGSKSQKIELTPIEFKLLHFMMKNPESTLGRNQLIEAVWGRDIHITERTVDKHISTLRAKIDTEKVAIKSIQGRGYKLMQITK